MAVKEYLGRAGRVAQLTRITVVSNTATNVVGVTIGGASETYTITSGLSVAQVASTLAAQLAASRNLTFRELRFTYTAGETVINVTALDPDHSFTVTAAGTSGAVTIATPSSPTGPHDAGNAANWTGGTLPADGDELVFDLPNQSVTLGLAAFQSNTFAKIRVTNRHNLGVGLPKFRRNGDVSYIEYRPRFLKVAEATRVEVDDPVGASGTAIAGPQVFAIHVTGGSCTASINSANDSDNDGEPPILLGLEGTGNTVHVTRGSVGIVADALSSVAATVATVNIGSSGDDGDVPSVFVTGTVTNLNNYSGVSTSATATTLLMGPEAVRHEQTAGNLTATVRGGELRYRTAGTLTVTADGPEVVVNLEASVEPKTLHNSSTFRNGAALWDQNGTSAGSTASFDARSAKASRVKNNVSISL